MFSLHALRTAKHKEGISRVGDSNNIVKPEEDESILVGDRHTRGCFVSVNLIRSCHMQLEHGTGHRHMSPREVNNERVRTVKDRREGFN